jgi:hypothetical protein
MYISSLVDRIQHLWKQLTEGDTRQQRIKRDLVNIVHDLALLENGVIAEIAQEEICINKDYPACSALCKTILFDADWLLKYPLDSTVIVDIIAFTYFYRMTHIDTLLQLLARRVVEKFGFQSNEDIDNSINDYDWSIFIYLINKSTANQWMSNGTQEKQG